MSQATPESWFTNDCYLVFEPLMEAFICPAHACNSTGS